MSAQILMLQLFVRGSAQVMCELGLTAEDARRALLSESYRSQPRLASGSPVRPGAHPFRKVIAASPRKIIEIWRGRDGVNPLARNSCGRPASPRLERPI